MKRTLIISLLLILTLGLSAGCYQTGRTAGEVVKSAEDGIDNIQKGYEHGKTGKTK